MPTTRPTVCRTKRKALRAAVAALACVFAVAVRAPAATPTIAELAPAGSMFVAGVDDFGKFKETFDRSSLRRLWDDPEFRSYITGMVGSAFEEPRRALGELNIDLDTFKPPAGSTGMALYLLAPEGDAAKRGGRGNALEMNGVIFADFLDDAAGADAVWNALDRLARKVVKDGFASMDEVEHGGVFITRVSIKYDEIDRRANEAAEQRMNEAEERRRAAGEQDPDAAMGDDMDWYEPSAMAAAGWPPQVHMARVRGVIVAGSRLDAVKEAIDRFNGEPARGKAIADVPEFTQALAQHGKNVLAPGTAYAALMVGPAREGLINWISGGGAPEGVDAELLGPMSSKFYSAITAGLGLDQVKAVSVAMRMDTEDAVWEQSIAVLVPEKRGLVSLFDVPAQRFSAPTIIPADAVRVLVQHARIAEIPALARSIVAGLPDDMRTEAQGAIDFVLPQIEPVLSSLGTEIAYFQRIERPFSPDAAKSTVAIRVTDQARLTSALGTLGANLGLAPRDFLGNQVWEAPVGGLTIGVGGGRLLFGQTSAVEGALREASEPDRPRLAAEPGFARAMRSISSEGLGFFYTQLRTDLEYAMWRTQNVDKVIAAQLERFGGDAEENRRFAEQIKASMPAWSKQPIPADAILRAMGDAIVDLRSTPEGFVSRSLTMHPAK